MRQIVARSMFLPRFPCLFVCFVVVVFVIMFNGLIANVHRRVDDVYLVLV